MHELLCSCDDDQFLDEESCEDFEHLHEFLHHDCDMPESCEMDDYELECCDPELGFECCCEFIEICESVCDTETNMCEELIDLIHRADPKLLKHIFNGQSDTSLSQTTAATLIPNGKSEIRTTGMKAPTTVAMTSDARSSTPASMESEMAAPMTTLMTGSMSTISTTRTNSQSAMQTSAASTMTSPMTSSSAGDTTTADSMSTTNTASDATADPGFYRKLLDALGLSG
ncbi:hypothetical protein Aperf_G00000057385 [Anoplocephala perfoliata]